MWADPACTILFSVIVFCTTLTIAKDTVHILIEGYPKVWILLGIIIYRIKTIGLESFPLCNIFFSLQSLDPYDKIYQSLLNIRHVSHVHGLKVWSLTVNHVELICHLGVLPLEDNGCVLDVYNSVLENATNMLRKKYDIEKCTIQIETVRKETLLSCQGCQPLKT